MIKRKNNHGFTLVELIVVVAILGLMTIMVFPSIQKLLKENENKEFIYYETAIKESGKLYYDQKKNDLTGLQGAPGCINVPSQWLIESQFLKDIKKDGITCSNAETGIRIERPSDGKVIYTPYIKCVKEGTNEVVFQKEAPSSTCEAFVAGPPEPPQTEDEWVYLTHYTNTTGTWTVPHTGWYRIFTFGASGSGGKGARGGKSYNYSYSGGNGGGGAGGNSGAAAASMYYLEKGATYSIGAYSTASVTGPDVSMSAGAGGNGGSGTEGESCATTGGCNNGSRGKANESIATASGGNIVMANGNRGGNGSTSGYPEDGGNSGGKGGGWYSGGGGGARYSDVAPLNKYVIRPDEFLAGGISSGGHHGSRGGNGISLSFLRLSGGGGGGGGSTGSNTNGSPEAGGEGGSGSPAYVIIEYQRVVPNHPSDDSWVYLTHYTDVSTSWTVPEEGWYRVFAFGASGNGGNAGRGGKSYNYSYSGGNGGGGAGGNSGAAAVSIFYFKKGETYTLSTTGTASFMSSNQDGYFYAEAGGNGGNGLNGESCATTGGCNDGYVGTPNPTIPRAFKGNLLNVDGFFGGHGGSSVKASIGGNNGGKVYSTYSSGGGGARYSDVAPLNRYVAAPDQLTVGGISSGATTGGNGFSGYALSGPKLTGGGGGGGGTTGTNTNGNPGPGGFGARGNPAYIIIERGYLK